MMFVTIKIYFSELDVIQLDLILDKKFVLNRDGEISPKYIAINSHLSPQLTRLAGLVLSKIDIPFIAFTDEKVEILPAQTFPYHTMHSSM